EADLEPAIAAGCAGADDLARGITDRNGRTGFGRATQLAAVRAELQIARRGRGCGVRQFRQGRVLVVVIDETIDRAANPQTCNHGHGRTNTTTGQSTHEAVALAMGQALER